MKTVVARQPAAQKSVAHKTAARQPVAARKTAVTQPSLFESAAPVKAKRSRVPVDFAAQYGEKPRRKRAVKEDAATRRARRDAALRQKMHDIMEPDDALLARLRRAGMLGGAVEEEHCNGARPARRGVKSPAVRRPRKWEARCGKCGNRSAFLTAAGLCGRCGAIMVREIA